MTLLALPGWSVLLAAAGMVSLMLSWLNVWRRGVLLPPVEAEVGVACVSVHGGLASAPGCAGGESAQRLGVVAGATMVTAVLVGVVWFGVTLPVALRLRRRATAAVAWRRP